MAAGSTALHGRQSLIIFGRIPLMPLVSSEADAQARRYLMLNLGLS